MTTCHACGAETDAAARFCSQCGVMLIEHTGAVTSIIQTGDTSGSLTPVGPGEVRALSPGTALLVIQRGPGQGSEFMLSADTDVISIGRAPEAEVFLDDVTVSRKHAEIRRGAEGWSIRDSGSLNGTYVNRVRVEDHRLRGGEEIQIGKFRFTFWAGAESTP
jgi:pSer/pThr/pTyr-binding forkhead associated (FHA) protein